MYALNNSIVFYIKLYQTFKRFGASCSHKLLLSIKIFYELDEDKSVLGNFN